MTDETFFPYTGRAAAEGLAMTVRGMVAVNKRKETYLNPFRRNEV
jgi:hypothetical protein